MEGKTHIKSNKVTVIENKIYQQILPVAKAKQTLTDNFETELQFMVIFLKSSLSKFKLRVVLL